MKKIFKSMMLLAVAAMAFTACNKEADIQETTNVEETTTIRFSATVNDVETKATLTTEDEMTFKAAWETGDKMDVAISGTPEGGLVQANWTGSVFEMSIPTQCVGVIGNWTYTAYYPSTSVPFGNNRTQKGNLYASEYDVMYGYKQVENNACGLDEDSNQLEIPMDRMSSILYFHLSSDLEEALRSATLTVAEGTIAAESVSCVAGDLAPESGKTTYNNITITFEEGNAPSANDFCLWYNILPGATKGLTLTVTTVSGKTATISNPNGKTYAAGKLNKVVKSVTFESAPFFYESFDQTDGTGGNDNQWSGSIASSSLTPDNEGWVFEKEGGANKCAKFGTGSAKGSATTPALGITSSLATLTFKAGAWNKDNTTLLIAVDGNGVLSESSVTMQNNAWSDYTIYIAGADESTKVKFYTEGASRFFLDEIMVVEGGTAFEYLIAPAEVIAEYSATSATFEIKTASTWTISGADEVEIDKTSGTGNATVTLTFPVNNTASDITIATLTITAGEKTATVVIKQSGNPDAIEELTIAEFLAKGEGDPYYRLTGTITDIENTTYGNFTLVDETGSVYVYGLTKTKVTSNDKSFASIGVEAGDIVTLEGKRASHNDEPQVGGPAYYISHVKAPKIDIDPASLVFAAEGGSKTVTATAFNFEGTVTFTAESNNTQFSTSVSGSTITITAAENTGNAEITGSITVTGTDGTNSKTATVEVSQNKPSQPAQDGDVLWQEDFTGYGTTMPSTATGTHVYEGGTVSYTLTNGGSDTKLYDATLAGGTTPELLVGKNNGAFKVSGIPTGSVSSMSLTYKANYDYCVITPSAGITLREDVSFENNLKTVYLIVPDGVTSFDLEFKNTNSANCRVDNFLLKAGAPKVKQSQTITFGDNKNVEWVIGTDCTLNTAKQGLTVTGAQTTVTYSSSNTEVATVDNTGMVTPLKAGTVTITANAAETEDYKASTDSYMLTITDPNAGTKQYTLTINANDFNSSSYADNNNEKTSNAIASDDSTFEVKWTSYQVMLSSNVMQWQKSKGAIYNSTDLGTIKSVTVNSTAGTFTTYYGEEFQPSSSTSVGGGYFQVKVGGATGKTTSIVVIFEK